MSWIFCAELCTWRTGALFYLQVCAFTAAADLIHRTALFSPGRFVLQRGPSSVPQRCRALFSVWDAFVSIWFTIWLFNVTKSRFVCCTQDVLWRVRAGVGKTIYSQHFVSKWARTKCETLICSSYVMWHVDGVNFFSAVLNTSPFMEGNISEQCIQVCPQEWR